MAALLNGTQHHPQRSSIPAYALAGMVLVCRDNRFSEPQGPRFSLYRPFHSTFSPPAPDAVDTPAMRGVVSVVQLALGRLSCGRKQREIVRAETSRRQQVGMPTQEVCEAVFIGEFGTRAVAGRETICHDVVSRSKKEVLGDHMWFPSTN